MCHVLLITVMVEVSLLRVSCFWGINSSSPIKVINAQGVYPKKYGIQLSTSNTEGGKSRVSRYFHPNRDLLPKNKTSGHPAGNRTRAPSRT